MIPSVFVFLEALPHTTHGKVERKALPAPGQARPKIEATYVSHRDDFERDLARTCEGVLGVHPVGVRDNLLDLGADSLTILKLVTQIEKVFGKSLAPAMIFHSPTVEKLAAILRRERSRAPWSSLVPIQPAGRRPPFFWIHGDYSAIALPRYLGPDQPLYGLEHQGQDGYPATYTDVETIAAYYGREIRAVQPHGPYFLGGYSFGAIIALELAQQMNKLDEDVAFLALLDPPSLRGGTAASSSAKSISETSAGSSARRDAIRKHVRKLTQVKPEHRLMYVSSRLASRVAIAFTKRRSVITRFTKKLIYRSYLRMNQRLPLSVRSRYILDIYEKAKQRYTAQKYQGPAILFKGENRFYNQPFDWEQLLQGEVEVYEVLVNHMKLREASYIHLWAEQLSVCLSKAQIKESADSHH
jgi:thioesterase domain-containing protein/aryl carrier-like protein